MNRGLKIGLNIIVIKQTVYLRKWIVNFMKYIVTLFLIYISRYLLLNKYFAFEMFSYIRKSLWLNYKLLNTNKTIRTTK